MLIEEAIDAGLSVADRNEFLEQVETRANSGSYTGPGHLVTPAVHALALDGTHTES